MSWKDKIKIKKRPPWKPFETFEMEEMRIREFVSVANATGTGPDINEQGLIQLNDKTMPWVKEAVVQYGLFDGEARREDEVDLLPWDFFVELCMSILETNQSPLATTEQSKKSPTEQKVSGAQ